MYAVRFRLPMDLAVRLGTTELQRSLFTTDWQTARRRCQAATVWFGDTMDQLRRSTQPSKEQLERADRDYFDRLKAENDGVRADHPESPDLELDYQVGMSLDRIAELELQVRTNIYDMAVVARAGRMLDEAGGSSNRLEEGLLLVARQLAARAELEGLRHHLHMMKAPWERFETRDHLFARIAPERAAVARRPAVAEPPLVAGETMTVAGAAKLFLQRKQDAGTGQSQLEELKRVLDWLSEVLGPATAVSEVTTPMLRDFREGLVRLRSKRGRGGLSFRDRQTNEPGERVKSVTATRYWSTVRVLFGWLEDERVIDTDPTPKQGIQRRRDEVVGSPEPFDPSELRQLFASPLFQGHSSARRYTTHGSFVGRGSVFWAGMLGLYTGMRAGEISQLTFADFDLDAPAPIVQVRAEDEDGQRTKRTKSLSATRDVPIADVLLALGLRQFVEGRRRTHRRGRVFFDVRLGHGDRKSDGLTKIWGRVLREAGVHRRGRAFHVFRHGFAAALRRAGVREEVIGALMGHSPQTVTGYYGGGKFPLTEMVDAVNRIEYGFDLVDAVGGPYDPKRHRA